MLSFFPRDVLGGILDLLESVSEGFPTYSKYNVALKTLVLRGPSEPEFYGDLVYKFRKLLVKWFSLSFQKSELLVIKRLVIT